MAPSAPEDGGREHLNHARRPVWCYNRRMDDEPAAVRFVVDVMLGRLAHWLRRLGYDTDYANDHDDATLARIARAESRVLLTRDRALAARRGLRALLIDSQVLDEQLAQVRAAFPLPPALRSARCSRCSECNGLLVPATRAEVAGRVPPYVLRTYAHFQVCPGCGRVYWPGSHRAGIESRLGT
jgi:uncharacterized protein with PIN domain